MIIQDIFGFFDDFITPSISNICGTVRAASPMKVMRNTVGPGSAKSANIQKAIPAAIQLIVVNKIA